MCAAGGIGVRSGPCGADPPGPRRRCTGNGWGLDVNERDWFDVTGLALVCVGALGVLQWYWSRWERKLETFIASPRRRAELIA